MSGEVPRRYPADLRDVEPEEHSVERAFLRLLDRGDRIAGRDLAVAVELHQLLLRQPVEVGHRGDDPLAPQPPDELLPYALDVHCRLHPVDERLEPA